MGLGVLSSVPSQAAVTNIAIATTNGTATLGQNNDTVTAAIVSVSSLFTIGAGETLTVQFINRGSQPGTGTPRMYFLDTATTTAPSATTAVIAVFKVAICALAALIAA